MGPEQSHNDERSYTRRRFITTGATASAGLYLAACGSSSSSSSSASASNTSSAGGSTSRVTLNNLFQQQAGYSASDLAGMTASFERANPNIKVNNTLVAYEALHDKIVAAAPAGTYDVVLGDVIWPAEFGSKGIVKDTTSLVDTLPTAQIFPGARGCPSWPRRSFRSCPSSCSSTQSLSCGGSRSASSGASRTIRRWRGGVSIGRSDSHRMRPGRCRDEPGDRASTSRRHSADRADEHPRRRCRRQCRARVRRGRNARAADGMHRG
jgi:hypothetical protein